MKTTAACFTMACAWCSYSTAGIVFIDIPDVVIDGVYQVVSVEFGNSQNESRAVNWLTFRAMRPPTDLDRSVHFYWHHNVIEAEGTTGGFTGIQWKPDDFPGYGSHLEVAKLMEGDLIGSDFTNDLRLVGHGGYTGDWNYDASFAYIGARFLDGGLPTFRYGWIRAKYVSNSLTIDAIAYETEGGNIHAGAIPEPSSTALWAGGIALFLCSIFRGRQINVE